MIVIKFFSLVIFGLALLNIVRFKGGWLERIGVSFLLGTGALSVIYFLYIWHTDRVISTDFWLITNFLTILLLIFRKQLFELKKVKLNLKYRFSRFNLLFLFLWFVTLFLFVSSLIYALYTPVHTVDSIYLFDFRAKIMFLSQKLSEIQHVENWYSFPMFTSMIGLFWRFLGTNNPSSYYPIMYISFALIFYSALRRTMGRNVSILGTFLMYTTPITFWQSQLDGLTNLPYTVFFCSAVIYLYKVFESREPEFHDMLISSIFLGLSIWTRASVPFWVLIVLGSFIIFKMKNKLWWTAPYLLIFYGLKQIWVLYSNAKFTSVVTAGQVLVEKISEDSQSLQHALLYTTNSTTQLMFKSLSPVVYVFFAFLLFDLFFRKGSKSSLFFLLMIIGVIGILYLGTLFEVLNFQLIIHLANGSLSRLLGMLSPLFWLYIMTHPVWQSVYTFLRNKQK